MVHGRAQDGHLDEFGVSGYVYKDTFLIFDRKTESLWYPLEPGRWTAVSGPRKGEAIRFVEEPDVLPLGRWREQHPETKVLLGSRTAYERTGEENVGVPAAAPDE